MKVLDNLYSGDYEKLKNYEDNPSFQFIEADVREKNEVENALVEIDAVLHEAAITSVPESVKNPELTREVNIKGTENLLEKSLEKGVERFVFASSCAVYGDPEELPIGEESSVDPESPYAESKLVGEKKCKEYSQQGLETVILRYFNVYGPGQSGGRYAGVISKFLDRLEERKPPIIYGDGNQTRDFVHVSDVVEANLLSLNTEAISGQVFNIGTGKSVSINKLCDTLLELTGNDDINPVYGDERTGDILHSRADIEKARKNLDYSPEIGLKEGLKTIIE